MTAMAGTLATTGRAEPAAVGGGPVVGSLVELLRARCVDAFDRPAIVEPTGRAGPQPGRMPEAYATTRELSWGVLIAAAVDLAAHFERSGLGRGDRLAHIGPQSPEWIVVDLACLLSGIVHVALHADEPRAALVEQLGWLAPQGMVCSGGPFCSGRQRTPLRQDLPPTLKTIDLPPTLFPGLSLGLSPGLLAARTADQPTVLADLDRRVRDCDPDAPAAIFLSSGTTGLPHGVVHCQRALAWNAAAATAVFLDDPRDVRLAWLPLSHALARTGDLYTALVRGSCLNLATDRRRLLAACLAAPPTVILGVPALFERLERGVRAGTIPHLPTALGGRVRVCVSGGAPLKERTAAAFADWGVPLVEGYGLAEAGPVVTLSNPRNARPGRVGPALDGVELMIDARPETRGQLLVRTPSRAVDVLQPQGQDAAAAKWNHDGWLQTGDLAEIDGDGHVRITGRLVDGLVLASGLKLPPAEVERVLAEDAAIAQVCVIGNGLPWPVAVIVPEPDVLRGAIRRLGLRVFSRRQALRHPKILQWLARRLTWRQRSLPRAWRVRRAVLIGRPFDAAHGEATPALKLKRHAIANHFQWVLDAAATDETPQWLATVPVEQAAGQPDARRHDAVQHETPQPCSRQGETMRSGQASHVAAVLWSPRDSASGFADAAARSAAAPRAAVTTILEQADRTIDGLRLDATLYDPLADSHHLPPPPIADAPPPPRGIFSRTAEEALGAIGFWGLAVPEPFGGTGCTMQELAAAITRMAANAPTAAGMLSVHSSIGAVGSLAAFGTADQQARHLPGLAQGRPLSIFGATEPGAGCDLSAVRAVVERTGDRLLLTGTKMFITGATHGRLVKVLALLDGRPAVALARLPDADTDSFRLRHYALHPLKHAHNAALEFNRFEIDAANLLLAPPDRHGHADAMKIIWHGLNRGRITLTAQAAGTLRILRGQAAAHARSRRTWGEPIAARQLVQGRLARIAARTIACDALAAWAADCVDAGQTGELEAITAKIVAGECVRESAIDALGVHGGRAFLVGHPLGDSFHDHLAVTVYEGESDLLGLALFKGLARQHPLAAVSRGTSAARRAAAWLAWRVGSMAGDSRQDAAILDAALRDHARHARRGLSTVARRIDRAIRRHGKDLAERQLEIGALSAEVRDLVSVLAVAHHADAAGDDTLLLPADCWCRLASSRASGRRLTAADHTRLAELGKHIATG